MSKNRTILIIDDSNTSLVLLEWALKEEGYNILIAADVNEARKIIARTKPDLILLDLFMPNVSGYDFLKMKPELNIEKTPIIIVSAYDSQDSVKQTKDLGASEFIAKPFNIRQIIETVKKYVG
jgi:putative two-component system response regulator